MMVFPQRGDIPGTRWDQQPRDQWELPLPWETPWVCCPKPRQVANKIRV